MTNFLLLIRRWTNIHVNFLKDKPTSNFLLILQQLKQWIILIQMRKESLLIVDFITATIIMVVIIIVCGIEWTKQNIDIWIVE